MMPPLLALNPPLAASLLEYRTRRLPAALANAIAHNQSGAMWPWESAVSGEPVSTWAVADEHEIHITGDIAHAFWRSFHATGNVSWLNRTAWPVLVSACDFLAARTVPVPAARRPGGNVTLRQVIGPDEHAGGNLTLRQVIGPDEHAGVVDSNAYTNALARVVLDACVSAAARLARHDVGPAVVARWRDVSERLWLPLRSDLYAGGSVHPQYEGYQGEPINQADVALLYYPLGMLGAVDDDVARRDLLFYQPLSSTASTKGYYTGDSAYSISWLALSNRTAADTQFALAFEHMDTAHFYVWSEIAHEGVQSGHLNFLTGAGGYLQNLIYGYGGLRYAEDELSVRPLLPPDSVTALRLRAVAFMGCRLTFAYNVSTLLVTLVSRPDKSGVALRLQAGGGAGEEPLVLGQMVSRPRRDGDRFAVRAVPALGRGVC